VETEREELIPGPPGIRLPQIHVEKWFWIGLATLVASIGFAIAALRGWGPPPAFHPSIDLAHGLLGFLTTHPNFRVPLIFTGISLNTGTVVITAIVLLWIAFARPDSPDRVAFVPAVTLMTLLVVEAMSWVFSNFEGDNAISFMLPIYLAGAAAIALAARGLRPVPRLIVWALCAIGLLQQFVLDIFAGDSPAMLVASLLLGMAVLAFGFEIAEQSGAALFEFDDTGSKPAAPIAHLDITGAVLLGSFGIAIFLAIGVALMSGRISLPPMLGRVLGSYVDPGFAGSYADGIARNGLLHVTGSIAAVLQSEFLWMPIATLALWVAFARPAFAERLLFAAGTIVGAIFLVPNLSEIFKIVVQIDPHFDYTKIMGYPSAGAVLMVAGGAGLFIGTRALPAEWRRAAEIFCVGGFACFMVCSLIIGVPPILLAGGIVLGASILVLALAIARRAGVDFFATPGPDADA
jgi:hypothetical protein